MILFSILSLMLISSVTVIAYVNYFTAMTEKERKRTAFQNKIRGRLASVKSKEVEKQPLLEDVA